LKGLSRFLYVWTHWETISATLQKRDERLQAVEDWAQQTIRLENQKLEAERRNLELEARGSASLLLDAAKHLTVLLSMEDRAFRDRVLSQMNPKLAEFIRACLDELEGRSGEVTSTSKCGAQLPPSKPTS
jgi:hypothetical protein